MEVKYDISKYVASVRMSAKKRILVEGRDDKSHVNNLLSVLLGKHKIKIDTAENIKGDCQLTAKNNRAKIEKIHGKCKNSQHHDNLHFLCDREFRKFDIQSQIIDLMTDHESDGNLCWTMGHSLENYFIETSLVSEAYRFLTKSEFKSEAVTLFHEALPSALKLIASISLAAKDIGKCSYPLGVIKWSDFEIENGNVEFKVDLWRNEDESDIKQRFKIGFKKYSPIVEATDNIICARVCRGHTAMQLLQRVFALCLYKIGCEHDEQIALNHAEEFQRIKESNVSAALCEAWLRAVGNGSKNYPVNLISSVA